MSASSTRARRFEGRSLVVTGATQGVGKQVALDAAAEGARLTIVDRSAILQEVAQEIASAYGQGRVIALEEDLDTFAGNERVMARTKESYGAIDMRGPMSAARSGCGRSRNSTKT